MDQSLLVKTNSERILDYLKIEYSNYFSLETDRIFAYYLPLVSERFEKLKFPSDATPVWQQINGIVSYKGGRYYGLYHNGLIKGMYNTRNNLTINLIRDPSRYFNICAGVIDYFFAKALIQQQIFRIHAACVSKGDSALLICGPKSGGKTTLLMKLLKNGYNFIADDSVYVQFLNNELICHPFPKSIKINYEDLQKFPNLYKNLKYHTIITSDAIKKAIIEPSANMIPIINQIIPVSQIIVPSLSDTTGCSSENIQSTDSSERYCVIDTLKKRFSFDFLQPSFRGEGLLNIDYIENLELIVKQDQLCEQALQVTQLKLFKIGKDLEEIDIQDYLI